MVKAEVVEFMMWASIHLFYYVHPLVWETSCQEKAQQSQYAHETKDHEAMTMDEQEPMVGCLFDWQTWDSLTSASCCF